MSRIVLVLVALTPGISYAADPKPEPVRRWVIETYKTLAQEARDNPLSQHQKMWDKLGECVLAGPIEMRTKVQMLTWNDGVLRIVTKEPLGCYERSDVNSLRIGYRSTYYVLVPEEEAAKIRRDAFVIITAKLQMFMDQGKYLKDYGKTHKVVLVVSTGNGKTAQLASDTIELEIGGSKYPVVYDK